MLNLYSNMRTSKDGIFMNRRANSSYFHEALVFVFLASRILVLQVHVWLWDSYKICGCVAEYNDKSVFWSISTLGRRPGGEFEV